MKVYELVTELMKMPAGAEVEAVFVGGEEEVEMEGGEVDFEPEFYVDGIAGVSYDGYVVRLSTAEVRDYALGECDEDCDCEEEDEEEAVCHDCQEEAEKHECPAEEAPAEQPAEEPKAEEKPAE